MSPLVARLDRFVRWFFNSSPTALIDTPDTAAKASAVSRPASQPVATSERSYS